MKTKRYSMIIGILKEAKKAWPLKNSATITPYDNLYYKT
jgi:hypothetical protein